MRDLDGLIKYEKEYTGLDFKRIQYNKEKHEALIKDIMSMANADIEGDRFIIIGVNYKNSNEREIIGIDKNEFINSSIYQQLIIDNVQPQIIFDYFLHEIDGKCLGIFKIFQCNDQPYIMKKDYGDKLKKGNGFIRKGDAQFPIEREDLDRIYAKRSSDKRFAGKVDIYFSDFDQNQEIALPSVRDGELPSDREADKLRKLISEEREEDRQSSIISPNYDSNSYGIDINPSFLITKDGRRIESLEKDLKNVKEKYKDDDLYEFFELRSHKLNITIMNESDEYIEDASLQVDVDKTEGLIILEEIYPKPNRSRDKFLINSNFDFRYPKVEDRGSYIRIHNSSRLVRMWNIRHQIPEEAFLEPVRFLFLKNLVGQVVELNYRLYGKNLREPIEGVLRIKVISDNEAK
jgi:hypothetical protein